MKALLSGNLALVSFSPIILTIIRPQSHANAFAIQRTISVPPNANANLPTALGLAETARADVRDTDTHGSRLALPFGPGISLLL